jgi:hypothetical protein
MTRTKSSRALVSVVLAVLMAVAFMPAISYTSFAATAKKATKVTKVYHKANTTYTRTVGSAWTLKYKLSPSKLTTAAKKVVWKSSNKSVVSVSAKSGNKAAVSFKKAGTATVTVYTKANKKAKATWKFKVVPKTEKNTTELKSVAVTAPNTTLDPAKDVAVGTVLKAAVDPATTDVTYQWYADDAAIAGATGSEFTVTNEQIGKAITVKAKSKNEVASAATAKVAVPTLDKVEVANANKTATKNVVGDTLKATATGSYTKADGTVVSTLDLSDAVSYQWYRGSVAADKAISGATSQTYTVTSADAGKTLYVVATPKAGVKNYPKQSVGTAITATANATLSIKTENDKLTAVVKDANGNIINGDNQSNTNSNANAKYKYQWAVSTNGTTFRAIDTADSAFYSTNGKEGLVVGNYYKVTVTTCPNNITLDKTTATVQYTGKFLQNTLSVFNLTRDGAAQVGDKLQIKGLADYAYGTDYTVTWYRSGDANSTNPITSVNLGTAQQYTLTSADAGQTVYAVVNGAGNYAGQTVTSATLGVPATNTLTLKYVDGHFHVYDNSNKDVTGYTLFRYKNDAESSKALDSFPPTSAAQEGYTYFAVKDGVKSNGLKFATGGAATGESVTVSPMIYR